MTVFQVPSANVGADQYRFDVPRRPFRGWRSRIGLLPLGLLLACSGCGTSPAGEAAATANSTASVPTNAPASGPSITLLVDGELYPVQSADLVMLSEKGGFTMGFDAGAVNVQVIGGAEAPLVVGKYAITDTASAVLITGVLPVKVSKGKASPEELNENGFSAPFIASAPADTPLGNTFIYDWGEGLRELRGRPLGQLVFTRVGDSTADGAFQSRVYRLMTKESSTIDYQGRPRALLKLEEHTVKATFRNLPFADYEKAMGDLQKALKGVQ